MRPQFAPGAKNAVRACLNIGERDRVCIIQDRSRADIAEAIAEEAQSTGAAVKAWVMEDAVRRPAAEFPRALADAVIAFKPTASFFIGGGLPGELAFRQPMLHLLTEQLRCRHGHMIGIDELLMVDGMAGDYEEIYRVTRRIWSIVKEAGRISVTSAAGTELEAAFSPSLRWISSDGRYWEQGQWGNLPEGEVFTCPAALEGVIVAEEVGDSFAERYGVLEPPVRFIVRGGRVAGVETANGELSEELRAYLAQHPNSSRAGEFAIGTNVGLTRIVGNFLQDEKFPGVHVAFGDPYGFETGADWQCPSHVDVLSSHATVSVDGRPLMENGRFLA